MQSDSLHHQEQWQALVSPRRVPLAKKDLLMLGIRIGLRIVTSVLFIGSIPAHSAECKFPATASELLSACQELLRSGRYSGAELGRIHYMLGHAHQNNGENSRALAAFDEAIRLTPRSAEFLYGRARTLVGMKIYDRAILDLTNAIELNPRSSEEYLFLRGVAHAIKKHYAAAIADYSSAIQVARDGRFVLARGIAYLQTNDLARADADLNEFPRLRYKGATGFSNNLLVWSVRYYKGIQDAGDYANWSIPPLDAFETNMLK
jgi:tetratricopeptide (TPR) repeat protein